MYIYQKNLVNINLYIKFNTLLFVIKPFKKKIILSPEKICDFK